MTALAARRLARRRLLAVALVLTATEVVWGPGGCDGCAAQVVRSR